MAELPDLNSRVFKPDYEQLRNMPEGVFYDLLRCSGERQEEVPRRPWAELKPYVVAFRAFHDELGHDGQVALVADVVCRAAGHEALREIQSYWGKPRVDSTAELFDFVMADAGRRHLVDFQAVRNLDVLVRRERIWTLADAARFAYGYEPRREGFEAARRAAARASEPPARSRSAPPPRTGCASSRARDFKSIICFFFVFVYVFLIAPRPTLCARCSCV